MEATRRRFLTIGAASAFCASRALAGTPSFAEALPSSVDVLVVGSGAAGLSAAISAKEAGAGRVLIVEKMPVVGGNTLVSSGVFNAPDSERQKPLGIEDSERLFFEQTYEAGRRKGKPALIRIMTRSALPTKRWLEAQGVAFQETPFQVYGGLWPRSFYPKISHGRGYVAALSGRCASLGIPIRTEAEATALLKDESGRVVGATVASNGVQAEIAARRAVIVASGGFSANGELCARLDPRLKGLPHTGLDSATGEMLAAAERAGAALADMKEIQCNLGPRVGHLHRSGFHLNVTRYILVNRRGERFAAEDGARDVLRDAVFAQPGGEVFAVVDRDGFQSMSSLFQQRSIMGKRTGDTFSAPSIRELARLMKVDPERLERTVAEYNAAVDKKRDALGRERWMLVHHLEKPPFFAAKVIMSVHYTMGGIVIDERARVLDKGGRVIPGLYAAGEATSGVHGSNRIGGNGLLDAFVFGRIAGREAAGESAIR